MSLPVLGRGIPAAAFAFALVLSAVPAEAGRPFVKRKRVVATQTVRPTYRGIAMPRGRLPDTNVYPMLGTFYPDPYVVVRSDRSAGGGYAPLDQFGINNLSVFGPLSAFRATAAPVLSYSRGYDGVVRTGVGTSFSYPNFPRIGPVVYPTRANVYPGFRTSPTPPWWDSSINWLDQN